MSTHANHSLVKVEKGEPVVSSEILGEGFEIPHRNILDLIKKYEEAFSRMGTLAVQLRKSGGKSVRFFLLNEKQSAFLGTLFRNKPKTVAFKEKLVEEFFRIRTALLNRILDTKNAEWLENRKVGKIARREETDTIKAFVDYATRQGSEHAQKYYMVISAMQNKALFLLEQKYPNLRDCLGIAQLSALSCADRIVARALQEGMAREMHYKDIFKMAKTWVEKFAELHGKSIVPALAAPSAQPQLSL